MLIDLIRLINENWRERRHRAPWQWLGSEFESVGRLRVLARKKNLFIFSYNTDNGTPSYYKTQSYIQHPKLLFNKRRQYWSTLNDSSYNLYMAWADFFYRQTSFWRSRLLFFSFFARRCRLSEKNFRMSLKTRSSPTGTKSLTSTLRFFPIWLSGPRLSWYDIW